MMRWLILCLIWAGAAAANAPDQSLRPVPRPAPIAGVTIFSEGVGVTQSLRPRARGEVVVVASPITRPRLRPDAPTAPVGVTVTRLSTSLRPLPRPNVVESTAATLAFARRQGQICGDPALQGSRLASIPGRVAGCGVAEPVSIRSVAGVRLSTAATMDCGTAQALKSWVNRGVKPAVGNRGGGVESLRVAAHYICRTRNNQPGARISEHGKGRAIDISAISLRDGSEISVLDDWGQGRAGRALREMWRAACGPFGTVLGPEADRFHRDHFHFDTARYRSGPYCR